jgi:hypothetical protein
MAQNRTTDDAKCEVFLQLAEEEEYSCFSATLQYRALSEDSFEKPDISSYNYF